MLNQSGNLNIDISSKTIVRIILWGFLVLAIFKLYNIILIILTSIVISSFVEYAVLKLRPYLKNRTLIVFFVYLISVGILVLVSSVFVPVFIDEMSLLVNSLGSYIPQNSFLNSFQSETISGAKDVVHSISSNSSFGEIIESGQNIINNMSGGFFSAFGRAFGGIFNVILIFILSLFFSLTDRGVENFLKIITPKNQEDYVIDVWRRTERKIGLWFQGQLLLGLIMGVLSYLVLTILGVKYALLLAIITALCEIIPYGTFIASIPAGLFAYFDGGITMGLIVVGLYFVLNQFENYLIYPLVVKKVIGISPLVVILSVLIGGSLAGFLGIVLAIPISVFLLEIMDDLEKKKNINNTI